jgi:hypothetical protein
MIVETSIDISADRARVFEAFTDLSAYVGRIQAIKNIEILSGNKAALGTRFKETRVMFGSEASETMEFTAFDPPSRFVLDARSHGSHYQTSHDFEEKAGITTVKVRFKATPETLFAKVFSVVFFFMKGSMVKAFQADLTDMKKFLEA